MKSLTSLVACVGMLVMAPLAPPAIAQSTWEGYLLGAEDQIEVQIYGQNNSTVRTRVKSDGTITLPLVGRVRAEGQTTQGLADAVGAQLRAGGFINDPIVNIEIVAYASRTVTMLGEFGTPGIYPLDRPLTLTEMVARVGGLRPGASDTVLVKKADGTLQRYSLGAIARAETPDVQLQPSDSIYASIGAVYFIYGQVGNAGVFPILPRMTIRQALARAGGPTLSGSERKITLYRGGSESEADLAALIQPDDVLFIRERIF